MAPSCSKHGCNSVGTKFCGACGESCYCSVICQKEDWKAHKSSCVDINKLPVNVLPVPQIDKFIKKAMTELSTLESGGKAKEAINLLLKLLAFVENQYGLRVKGTSYSRRGNGDLVDNIALINIRIEISRLHGAVGDIDSQLANTLVTRQLLEPRNESEEVTLRMLVVTEKTLALVYTEKHLYAEAELHCEQCMFFARMMKRASKEYQALMTFSHLRGQQGRHQEAIDLAEKAYILASDTHGPMHRDVQFTVSWLIDELVFTGEYSRADDYCRINYENLIDPRYGFDQEGEEVAEGMYQLASIWVRKAPVDDEEAALAAAEEAERMIRRACSIMGKLNRHDSMQTAGYQSTFGVILLKRRKYTEETRSVLEHSLALSRQRSASSLDLIKSLKFLVYFHNQVMDSMAGEARERVMLRDAYVKEIEGLESILKLETIRESEGVEEVEEVERFTTDLIECEGCLVEMDCRLLSSSCPSASTESGQYEIRQSSCLSGCPTDQQNSILLLPDMHNRSKEGSRGVCEEGRQQQGKSETGQSRNTLLILA